MTRSERDQLLIRCMKLQAQIKERTTKALREEYDETKAELLMLLELEQSYWFRFNDHTFMCTINVHRNGETYLRFRDVTNIPWPYPTRHTTRVPKGALTLRQVATMIGKPMATTREIVRHRYGLTFTGHGNKAWILEADLAPKLIEEARKTGELPHSRVVELSQTVATLFEKRNTKENDGSAS